MIVSYNLPFSSLKFNFFNDNFDENFSLKTYDFNFSNGFKLKNFEFLKSAKDFSINNNTLFLLSNFLNLSSFLEKRKKIENLKNIETLFISYNGFILREDENNTLINTLGLETLQSDIFLVEFKDDFLQIKNNKGFYLTYNEFQNKLNFEIFQNSDFQKFNYYSNNETFLIFPKNKNFSKIVQFQPNIECVDYTNFLNNNYENYSLILDSLKIKNINNNYSLDYLIKYSGYTIDTDELEKDSYMNIKSNYLFISNLFNSKNLEFHALKNYLTPEYEESFGYGYYDNNKTNRRSYEKIYTGNNEDGGFLNCYLGYLAKTKKIIFKNDKETVFYYPAVSPSVKINQSGLIEDGAISGNIPYESDKLFVENSKLSEIYPQITFPYDFKKDWFFACSWLSGNNNGESIWVDRFYNPIYYTLDDALSSDYKKSNIKDIDGYNTIDVISNLSFEPFRKYKYSRFGKIKNKEYLEIIGNYENSKILDVDEWDSKNLRDKSFYKNDGIVYTQSDPNNKNYLNLDGETHVIFSSNKNFYNTSNITVNFFFEVDDWNNIKGEHIVGNYYNGGYGFINETNLNNPTFTIIDVITKKIHSFNDRFFIYNTTNSKNNFKNSNITHVQKLPDFSYWVFDRVNLIGEKFDIDGNLLTMTNNTTLSSYIKIIDEIKIDKDQNIYLFNKNEKTIVKINENGEYVNNYSLNGNSFNIDLNDTLIDSFGDFCDFDSQNNKWEIVGGNLYKNSIIYANIGNVNQILFDDNDNLWISHDGAKITKINTIKNTIEFSIIISDSFDTSGNITNPCDIKAIIDYTEKNKIQYRSLGFVKSCDSDFTNVLIIIDSFENFIYALREDGVLLSKLNLKSISENSDILISANGDFTGYNYSRKYGKVKKSLSWKYKTRNIETKDISYNTLTFPTTSLQTGWHMFTFTFDSNSGKSCYYIDSILINGKNHEPQKTIIDFEYNTPFVVGANIIKNKILNDLIEIQNCYKSVGKISDLKVYKKTLTPNQVKSLFLNFWNTSSFADLNWNMPTGERFYIEEIDKWYKMQITGSKSNFYNLKIKNLKIEDEKTQKHIEETLKKVITKISPSYTVLNDIKWN